MNSTDGIIRRGRGRDRQERNGRRIFFYLLIAALVSTMVLTYIWTFVKMAEARLVIRELRQENLALTKELDGLQARVAHLSSTVRIEQLARDRLDMRLPMRVEFLSIDFIDEEAGSERP